MINDVHVLSEARSDLLPEWTRQKTGSATTVQVSAFPAPSLGIGDNIPVLRNARLLAACRKEDPVAPLLKVMHTAGALVLL